MFRREIPENIEISQIFGGISRNKQLLYGLLPEFFNDFFVCSETLKNFLLSVSVFVLIKEDIPLLLTSTFASILL